MQFRRAWVCLTLLTLICSFTPNSALAQDGLDSGDTVCILISTGLVLFMMILGLALFYAGLVRSRNVLSIFIHCFGTTALITVIWTLCGYSLAFTANNPFIGNLSKSFLLGIMWFSGLWCLLVYMPIAHMVWGEAGFFSAMGVFDFAGSIVVHITAGTAALVAAILVGKRQGYPERPMPLHSITMNLIGTVMLWVGWFGLNGGSAMAVVVTKISPSVLGFATGAMAIAFVASVVAYWAATWLQADHRL